MTTPTTTNVAQGDAHVGVQAQAIHGDVYYQLPPDASPKERFRTGVKYLDARMPGRARELIEEAVARGHETDEVRFHWLLALLSGRTLRQLGNEDLITLSTICGRITRVHGRGEWTVGLRSVLRLLSSLDTADTELTVKELDELRPRQRDKILDHLGVLLEGPVEDQLWHRSVERARAGQKAGDRRNRVRLFFHPVTFLIVPSRGPSVARPGMTSCPCRLHDPGGVVAGSGGVGGPLIGTRPPVLG
ncbi:hypothetical protein GA0070610_1071 [Micromonospora echinofusca]|uniref:Uncharacterized protein n=1 Tax=Micromonospora echinofusca TaxID=47858 RepID=A0A1C5G5M3_MICEH|nr:hypothetical protein [Micromonospora echinofusca]SCG14852.1 hypothetical protein GA0070610_1071 [Micromonospora echinofusca]